MRGAQAGDGVDGLARGGVEDGVFGPAGGGEEEGAPWVGGGGGSEDFGDGAGAHGVAGEDGGDVEARGVDVGGDPAALGGVVGKVDGAEEELGFLEGGEGDGAEGEGWGGACELGEGSGGVGEDPLAGAGWVGHGWVVGWMGFAGCWRRGGGGTLDGLGVGMLLL